MNCLLIFKVLFGFFSNQWFPSLPLLVDPVVPTANRNVRIQAFFFTRATAVVAAVVAIVAAVVAVVVVNSNKELLQFSVQQHLHFIARINGMETKLSLFQKAAAAAAAAAVVGSSAINYDCSLSFWTRRTSGRS